jgi:hypothetical protein
MVKVTLNCLITAGNVCHHEASQYYGHAYIRFDGAGEKMTQT